MSVEAWVVVVCLVLWAAGVTAFLYLLMGWVKDTNDTLGRLIQLAHDRAAEAYHFGGVDS